MSSTSLSIRRWTVGSASPSVWMLETAGVIGRMLSRAMGRPYAPVPALSIPNTLQSVRKQNWLIALTSASSMSADCRSIRRDEGLRELQLSMP